MLSIPPVCYNAIRKPTGAKLALKPVHVWGIRIRLQVAIQVPRLGALRPRAKTASFAAVTW